MSAPAGYTLITGGSFKNAAGQPLLNGRMDCFGPVNNQSQPVSATAGGGNGGLITVATVSFLIVNGALTTDLLGQPPQLADSTLANPANIGYKVAIVDTSTNEEVQGPGYACVQCSGPSWSFDTYNPVQPALVTVQPGPAGLSAYQVAQANGFSGSQADWLVSLKGPGGGVSAAAVAALAGKSSTPNLYFASRVTPGGFVNPGDGTIQANNAFVTSDFIPMVAGATYTTSTSLVTVGYYDASFATVSVDANGFRAGDTFTAPTGTVFCRVSPNASQNSVTMIVQGALPANYVAATPLDTATAARLYPSLGVIQTIATAIASKLSATANLFISSRATQGGYVSPGDGSANINPSIATSDFIPMTPGAVYTTSAGLAIVDYYDSNFAFISGSGNGVNANGTFSGVPGCYFSKVCFNLAYLSTLMISAGPLPATYVSGNVLDTASASKMFPSAAAVLSTLAANLPASRNRCDPSQFVPGILNANNSVDSGNAAISTAGLCFVGDCTAIVFNFTISTNSGQVSCYDLNGIFLGALATGSSDLPPGTVFNLLPGTVFVRFWIIARTPVTAANRIGLYAGTTLPSYFLPWADYATLQAAAKPLIGRRAFISGDSIAGTGWIQNGLMKFAGMSCVVNSANQLISFPTYTNRGAWAQGSYNAGDLVYVGPHYYFSLVAGNTSTPGSAPASWALYWTMADVAVYPGSGISDAWRLQVAMQQLNPSGPTLTQIMGDCLSNKDVCLVEYGTNDGATSLGSPTDAAAAPGAAGATFCAYTQFALQTPLAAVAATGRNCKVVLISPFNQNKLTTPANTLYGTNSRAQIKAALVAIGLQWSVPVLDMEDLVQINPLNWDAFLQHDTNGDGSPLRVHPNSTPVAPYTVDGATLYGMAVARGLVPYMPF